MGALVIGGLESIAPDVINAVKLHPTTANLLFYAGAGYYGLVLNGSREGEWSM